MADTGQRTEQPTPKRLDKARKEGQFPSAPQFVSAVQFLAFVAVLAAGGGQWYSELRNLMRHALEAAFGAQPGGPITEVSRYLLLRLLALFAPTAGILLIVTLGVQLIASQLGVSLKKLGPDLQRLNPLSRLRELPRQNLPALARALVMLPLFGMAVYGIVRDNLFAYMALPYQGVESGFRQACSSLGTLLWKGGGVFLVFGAVDLFRQRRRYRKDLRMSKQEIRDEVKESEGNPQIKARIRRIQRDRLRRQMMKEVPKATAVIVNPTHYAVALRYAMDSMATPVVVAKGKNYLAARIRQKAIENQVPIIENPPVAQALYRSVEVGQEIPAHLYRAVAEILAYVYKLMNSRLPK
ncbi:MAG TPA: EscU/YscU/HrcU family type III secretion system export apparatus switch protein [Bryobacteraceae bacterium]|nr:EscU/YscU/HrcU family type III secretion system export apparatus switch protein [Bryobacteraceae bacterium]